MIHWAWCVVAFGVLFVVQLLLNLWAMRKVLKLTEMMDMAPPEDPYRKLFGEPDEN